MQSIVVVGGSLAGLRAVQALRKRGYSGRLQVVSGEPHAPYDRPPLSKQLLSGEWPKEKLFFGARENHAALEVEWRLGERATQLAPRDRTLWLGSGEKLRYDGLVIATGATPRQLPAAAGLAGCHVLRTLDDALALRAALEHKPRVAVIGAGFIGLEVASSARKLGLSVALIEPQPQPLASILGEAVGRAIAELHAAHGVELHLGVGVSGFEGSGRVERVRLSDGRAIEADVVVVGIGVVPETAWLEGSGVALSNGVLCDATLASNVPDVVAAGDVARWPNAAVGGEPMRVEHWSNAVEQGQAAAARLLDGAGASPYVHVPYFWSDQYDRKVQCAGRPCAGDAFTLLRGALDAASFAAVTADGDRLTGVLTSNSPALFLRLRKLLSEGASLSVARESVG
jgi:3-phenylpropionate/trans-cinnamate dioxygenase ferredoxin reductase subunit